MPIETAWGSHVGRQRSNNEDVVRVAADPAGDTALLVVADGMGGHAGGEVASAIALERFCEEALPRLHAHDAADEAAIGAALQAAIAAANAAVLRGAERDPALWGMGTTLVAAWLRGPRVTIVHVGDSRAYLVRRDGLEALSQDHTVAEERVRAGRWTAAEAWGSQARHVLTRVVGSRGSVVADQRGGVVLAGGDTLLLCSDGLHDVVVEDRLAAIVRDAPLPAIPSRLIDAANAEGGPDNITVALARYQRADG